MRLKKFVAIILAMAVLPLVAGVKDKFLAHRGASEDAPENTPAAYEKAVESGFGFECDVYLTKDGHIFSFHDPDLKRIAGINKRCCDCTWDEIKGLDVGKWKGPEWAGQHPSEFKDILALARDGRIIQVHVKTGPEIIPYLKKELDAQKQANPKNMVFATSNPKTAAALKDGLKDYQVWLGFTAKPGKNDAACPASAVIAALRNAKADVVAHRFNPKVVTAEYVAEVHKAGFGFNVWTVDNPDEARLALKAGVDSITSNCPKKVLAGLARN
jgi:glycerophosphoryl diester phosphodiesterase